MSKYGGVEKLQMRVAASSQRRFSKILDLCSEEARSVKFFLENGNADEHTEFTIIERNRKILKQIDAKFKKYKLKKPRVFNGVVERCPFSGPFDLVNLDTCSTPSERILGWIGNLEILSGGELNLWTTAFRNKGAWRQKLIDAFLYTKLGVKILHEVREKSHSVLDNADISVDQRCVAAALSCVLCNYDFDFIFPSVLNRPLGQYNDNRNPMYVYRLINITKKSKQLRSSLGEVLEQARFSDYETVPTTPYNKNGNCEKSNTMLSAKILSSIRSGKRFSEITRTINKILSDADYLNKNKKMIKAGFKAQITKMEKDLNLVRRAHAYIDRF